MYYNTQTQGFHLALDTDNPSGYVELTNKEYRYLLVGQESGKTITAGSDGRPILVDHIPTELSVIEICASIDSAADAARLAVVGDPLRATEYERAAAEAQAFKDAGYPIESVPRTVAAYAINGRSAQESADSILAESAAYTEALYCLRETRLSAKELVRQAMAAGNTAEAEDIAAEAIATIEAMIDGVGNSPA